MPKMSKAERAQLIAEMEAVAADPELQDRVADAAVQGLDTGRIELPGGATVEWSTLEDQADEPDTPTLAEDPEANEYDDGVRYYPGPGPEVTGLAPGFEFEMVPVDRLQEHPKNANRGDLAAIGASVSESGFYGAVVAQRSTGYILAGNHRYRVARERGLGEVPVTWVDVDAIGAVRILLADNETARRGHMDLGAQDALLQELREVDPELRGTGFDVALSEIAAAEAAEEEAAAGGDKEPEHEDFGARYGVIVMCRDEAHQAEVYEKLAELDLGELRVVAV